MEKVKNFLKWAFSPSMILTFLALYVFGVKLPQGINSMYTDCKNGVKTVYDQSVNGIGSSTFNAFKNSTIGCWLGLSNKLLPLHDGDFVVFKPVSAASIARSNDGIFLSGSRKKNIIRVDENDTSSDIDLSKFSNPGDGINVKIKDKQCIIIKNKLGSIELLVQDDDGEYKNKGIIWQACGGGVDNDTLSANIPGFRNNFNNEQMNNNSDDQSNQTICSFVSICRAPNSRPFTIQESDTTQNDNESKSELQDKKHQDIMAEEDDDDDDITSQSDQIGQPSESIFTNNIAGKSDMIPDEENRNLLNLFGLLPRNDKVEKKNEFYLSRIKFD